MGYPDLVFGKLLSDVDEDLAHIIDLEEQRQSHKIIMIPSESICPLPVRQALSSGFTDIYAEGYPSRDMIEEDEKGLLDFDWLLANYRRYSDRRFYKGCEYANFVEALAQKRAASLFATEKNPKENIFVNVQPLSGAAANNSVYEAFVKQGDVVMGMSLMHGGHLTHGSEFNRSGKSYRIVSYEANPKIERLDYNEIMNLVQEYKPKMIIAGYTSYPWAPDWEKFREIADSVGAILFADISHPAGLVIAGVYPNPIDYADVTTFTTHKTLFGPRGAMILTTNSEYAEKIDQSVFPGEQGGPHVNKFAAIAVALKIAQSKEFKAIQKKIVDHAKYLGEVLKKNGIKLAYGGTDTHLLVIDCKSIKTKSGYQLKGEIAVRILDLCGIVANKNTIPGDTVTAEATGVRMGTPWITQRGIKKEEIEHLGNIIAYVLKNINPFTYTGLTGVLPRGKIDLQVLEEAQKRTETLAKGLASEQEIKEIGYPHHSIRSSSIYHNTKDYKNSAVLFIKGKRAVQFLEGISTNKILGLNTAEAKKTFFLDKAGNVLSVAQVARLYQDERGNDQFIIICDPEYKERLKRWMRGLSDGYIAFNDDDIFMKIEGPVIVKGMEELSEEMKIKIKNALENIQPLAEEHSDIGKKIDTKTVYNIYPQYFDLSKPYFIGQKYVNVNTQSRNKKTFVCSKAAQEIKRSVLHEEHIRLTDNMVNFAGWKMPVRYESIINEHTIVRETAGIFDISHMGILEISGEYATSFLDTITANYVPWIDAGESQYSYLLDLDGNVIDDIMIYKLGKNRYMVVVNAANNEKDLAWINAVNSGEYIIDKTDPKKEIPGKAVIQDLKNPSAGEKSRVNISLQGPNSLNILKEIAPDNKTRDNLERIQKTEFIETELAGIEMIVSRTGYTGEEIGYEIIIHPSNAADFWNLVLEKGKKFGVKPIGLGARDSLRTEAGLPLYGHELAGPFNISPIESGFAPYVKFHKPFFIGRDVLFKKMKESSLEIARFRMDEKGVKMAKTKDVVVSKRTQKVIGAVTSCAVNKEGIQVGMAYIDKRFVREGAKVAIIPFPHSAREKIKSLEDVEPGDRIQLHVDATIVTRFPEN